VIHADKIIVLEKGRVVDQGTHNELIKRSQLYKRLCQLQFQPETLEDEIEQAK
jgi:ATP-binding cassette subfamily B protein